MGDFGIAAGAGGGAASRWACFPFGSTFSIGAFSADVMMGASVGPTVLLLLSSKLEVDASRDRRSFSRRSSRPRL